MKKLLLLIAFVAHFSGFSQSENQISWYKMLAGTIDNSAVTLHFHKAGHQYSGYYYYNLRQQPVFFIGEDTTQPRRIKLSSFAGAEGTEEFDFLLQGNKANGTWKKEEKEKPQPFNAEETAAPVSFTNVTTAGAVKLRPNLKVSPQAEYEASSVWPNGNTPADAFLKKIIGQSFSKRYNENEEIGRFFLKEKKAYFANYLRRNKNVKNSEIKNALPVYTASVSKRLMVAYQSAKLLTFAFSAYSYTGGAHGNYGTVFTSLDITNAKKLTLPDVINPQGQMALGSLLEKSFKTTHNLSATDSLQKAGLFDNSIKPNDNFYVTAKGIGFTYNPYEIGPYVMGEITIFIPITDLDKYLQPKFRTLIQ